MSVGVAVDGSTATLMIDNPPANAWTMEDIAALTEAVSDLRTRPTLRCLILTGAGSRFFSAGADIRQFDHSDSQRAADAMSSFAAAFDALATFPTVTIAAINGYALGGGLECALACDLRIVEEHAILGLPETLVGLLPGGGGTQRLTRLVGPSRAKRMILLAERVDAATAARIGLADETVVSGQALQAATEWATQAARPSPDAVRACKRLIDDASDMSLPDGLMRERSKFAALFGTDDQREGVTAFLEKRPASWSALG